MPALAVGMGAGIPPIRAISLHTPDLSRASCTPRPLQGTPQPSSHPQSSHSGLSACMRRLFTLKPTDSSSEQHQAGLCSGLGALAIGGFLPLLSKHEK